MAEVGFSVEPSKNAKSQALACIKLLQDKSKLPIQRARMRVRITIPATEVEKLQAKIHEEADKVEDSEKRDTVWETVSIQFRYSILLKRLNIDCLLQTLQIDPSKFRVFKDLLDKECKEGRLDIVDHTVTANPAAAASA